MTRMEVIFRQVFNQTMTSGKARDLRILLDLLKEYGAVAEVDLRAEMEAGADDALRRIFTQFDRHFEIDTEARDTSEKMMPKRN